VKEDPGAEKKSAKQIYWFWQRGTLRLWSDSIAASTAIMGPDRRYATSKGGLDGNWRSGFIMIARRGTSGNDTNVEEK
jgi:hypothetical protein